MNEWNLHDVVQSRGYRYYKFSVVPTNYVTLKAFQHLPRLSMNLTSCPLISAVYVISILEMLLIEITSQLLMLAMTSSIREIDILSMLDRLVLERLWLSSSSPPSKCLSKLVKLTVEALSNSSTFFPSTAPWIFDGFIGEILNNSSGLSSTMTSTFFVRWVLLKFGSLITPFTFLLTLFLSLIANILFVWVSVNFTPFGSWLLIPDRFPLDVTLQFPVLTIALLITSVVSVIPLRLADDVAMFERLIFGDDWPLVAPWKPLFLFLLVTSKLQPPYRWYLHMKYSVQVPFTHD